jgi:hypothetical protein
MIHERDDERIGQPFCGACYDYVSHVLFTWYLPELWRRFTIALRRAVRQELKALGVQTDSVRISFVKVVEMQARAVPHIHALIRLDPAEDATGDRNNHGPTAACGGGEPRQPSQPLWQPPITAVDLAGLINRAARQIVVTVPNPTADRSDTESEVGEVRMVEVRFGSQIDAQPIAAESSVLQKNSDSSAVCRGLSARRVAHYLAKYVTKSLQELGIAARRLSAGAIASLDVSEHVRAILTTIASFADESPRALKGPLAGIGRWLHTLGYRGHITTKSRHYSTTMTALRSNRADWTRQRKDDVNESVVQDNWDSDQDMIDWAFDSAGYATSGDRSLVYSASLRHIEARRVGLAEARRQVRDEQWNLSGGRDG